MTKVSMVDRETAENQGFNYDDVTVVGNLCDKLGKDITDATGRTLSQIFHLRPDSGFPAYESIAGVAAQTALEPLAVFLVTITRAEPLKALLADGDDITDEDRIIAALYLMRRITAKHGITPQQLLDSVLADRAVLKAAGRLP